MLQHRRPSFRTRSFVALEEFHFDMKERIEQFCIPFLHFLVAFDHDQAELILMPHIEFDIAPKSGSTLS